MAIKKRLNPRVTIELSVDEINRINALEDKDEAMPPACKFIGSGDDAEKYYYCGVCGEYIGKRYKYCSQCGQRIDTENIAL